MQLRLLSVELRPQPCAVAPARHSQASIDKLRVANEALRRQLHQFSKALELSLKKASTSPVRVQEDNAARQELLEHAVLALVRSCMHALPKPCCGSRRVALGRRSSCRLRQKRLTFTGMRRGCRQPYWIRACASTGAENVARAAVPTAS